MTTNNNNKKTQAATLLNALKEHGPLTTSAARDHLGLMHPAGRVNELRAAGHLIDTAIVWETDSSGALHKQACYSLKEADHG